MKKLEAFFQAHHQSKILDVGTGSGQFIQVIQSMIPEHGEIIGIDLSEKALDAARKQFSEDSNIHFEKMDATAMSFADNTFDVVCLSNSLHHLPDITKAMDEMKRVVKQDGVLFFVEMRCDHLNPQQESHRLIHHFAGKIDRACGIWHRDTYSKTEIIDLISGTGSLKILDAWDLLEEQREAVTPEDCERLLQSLDRQVDRISDPSQKNILTEEAEQIKQYVRKNLFDSATELLIIAQKL